MNWTKEDIKHFLADIEVFGDLPDDVHADLAKKATIRTFPAGKPIFKRGETGNSLFVMASGKVRITLESPKGKQDVSILGKGDFFGEIAMMTHAHRTATVTTAGEVAVLEFSADDILPLTEQYPRFKTRIARTGAERSRESLSKLLEE